MQQGFAVRLKSYKHFAVILFLVSTPQGIMVNETIYRFHPTVMAKTKLLAYFDHFGLERHSGLALFVGLRLRDDCG
jgi:hypothetical protein